MVDRARLGEHVDGPRQAWTACPSSMVSWVSKWLRVRSPVPADGAKVNLLLRPQPIERIVELRVQAQMASREARASARAGTRAGDRVRRSQLVIEIARDRHDDVRCVLGAAQENDEHCVSVFGTAHTRPATVIGTAAARALRGLAPARATRLQCLSASLCRPRG
jgi:hypothetical protein